MTTLTIRRKREPAEYAQRKTTVGIGTWTAD